MFVNNMPNIVGILKRGRSMAGDPRACGIGADHKMSVMARQRPIDKCKLCGLVKELCDSHYLPKRLYAFLRAAQLQNPNPLMGVAGKLRQVSTQFRDYVFCDTCEDLFSKHGEKWV